MNDVTEDDVKKFREELERCMDRGCYKTKTCKDSSLECVILNKGKRIALKGKGIWSTKKYAEKAIQKSVIEGKLWWTDTDRVWNSAMNNYKSDPPFSIQLLAKEMREAWAEKNLIIMPLREYMVFEHKRLSSK